LDVDEENVHVIGTPLYEKEHDPKKHEKHLCRLVEAGTTMSEYSRLAFKGNYLCKQCGRVANAEECLCKHLCRLVEAGTTMSEYSRLAFKGNYLCKQCGRVANAEECLCEPVDMRQIRF